MSFLFVVFSLLLLSIASAVFDSPIFWCGAVTENSIVVVARVTSTTNVTPTLIVESESSSSLDNNDKQISISYQQQSTDQTIFRFSVSNLQANTSYRYFLDSNHGVVGRFTTPLPENEAQQVVFVVASCAERLSNHPIFQMMANDQKLYNSEQSVAPQFYLNTGDLSYEDISTNDFVRSFL
jgi:phosphodiesterase/alkaline phosphatase D-like protein